MSKTVRFEHLGTVRLKPRRHTLRLPGMPPISGTLKEWATDWIGGAILLALWSVFVYLLLSVV